ncbi:MAG: RtcB family protein [Ignavibacteriaceae bacterium]|jgi:tRNA-splicing ligase RtcB|nr:RtcB family protein [Ignavibacteriaceae bacterium]
MKRIKIFGREIIDEKSIAQIERCISEDDIGVLTADAHYGYGHPIGGAVAYKNRISLSGVGFDIACGNKAIRTDIKADEINISKIMDEIYSQISFGIGRKNKQPVDHEVIGKIADALFKPQRKLFNLAKEQLGTVGSGNHFVDLFEDDEGYLWIGVHFGSRGFGHRTTMGFIALSKGYSFEDKVREGPMDSPPILFDIKSEIGESYIEAIRLAGEYAYAGRDIVVDQVLKILDNPSKTFEVHNHHNFAWKEEHFGKKYWVVRKGCTPAFPKQLGFIGANMMDDSVIVEGVDSELSKEALYSTVHGAGRTMSRNEAAGKKKWKRDRDGVTRPVTVGRGKVNFEKVKSEMIQKGIELRGSGADEAPECYKNLDDVISYMGNTIKVIFRLHPIGVAMAGSDVYDPYKD